MAASPSQRRPRNFPSRKRFSASRLSTDTTASLPAYSSPTSRQSTDSDWTSTQNPHLLDDQPPGYPQSAEEADEEDDFVPHRSPRSTAPRRSRHRRSESTSLPASPSVDDLLERSVVALEMSTNALLQSINTQSSISAIANDRILERSLDRQARMLDLRMRGARDAHEGWMDDLEELMKGVDGLFANENGLERGISRSLPSGNSHIPSRQRDHHAVSSKSDSPYLHLSTSELDLQDSSRPPRALTQYVSVESASGETCETTADSQSIYLPSTTGLRSAPHVQSFADGAVHPVSRQPASSPGLDSDYAPHTPAETTSSHFTTRSSSQSPPCTVSPSASLPSPDTPKSPDRRPSRRYSASSLENGFTLTGGLKRSRSNSQGRSSVSTEHPPPVRAMTPPMEEVTPSSSSSISSLNAFRTMQSLRKILDEAPPDAKGKRPEPSKMRRRFQPRSPSVAPSSGTSTATASVTRLLTRSSHHGSHMTAHARQSSLKKRESPASPDAGTPTTAPSTPRNVSFAELPDSYSGQSLGHGRDNVRDKGKGKDKGRERNQRIGWWTGWLTDLSESSIGAGGGTRNEERMEERFVKGWGRPGVGGGGTEEWML